MWPNLGLIAVTTLVAVAVTARQRSPLAASLWLWVAVFALHLLAPLRITPISPTAAIIVAAGLLAMSLPALPRMEARGQVVGQGDSRIALTRLVGVSVLAGVLVLVGAMAFRSGVEVATGQGFGQLSIQEIRRAQTGSARGGGLLALVGSAGPLLACLGVYGMVRFSKIWAVLLVVAFAASLQTPARLTTISLIVQVVIFYLYIRPNFGHTKSRVKARRPWGLIGAGLLASLIFFNYLGLKLGKNGFAAESFPQYSWPDWTLSPVLYFTGGISALSAALNSRVNPFDDLSSVFSLARIAAVVNPNFQIPDTLSAFVPIPLPFNVYTGFGQIFYDFGLVGVIALSALLGWVATRSHRRALVGRVEWAWVASVVAPLLLSLPQAYRLFYLDTDFQLFLGFLGFWFIRQARPRSGPWNESNSTITRVTAGAPNLPMQA